MWKATETDFNLEKHLITFLQESPFYAEVSRHIRKTPSTSLPTAAVAWNKENDELTLYWNPKWMAELSNWEVRGVLLHEFNHLIFGHLASRRKEPHKTWNIATDLAINSLIIASAGTRRDDDKADSRPLPRGALIPGEKCYIDPEMLAKMSPEAVEGHKKFSDLIASFPTLQTSEWYFHKLQEAAKGDPQMEKMMGDGEGELTLDDHGGWDDVPEDMREYLEGKIKSIVEKGVNHADATPGGWGSMPVDLQREIRRSVSRTVDWRSVLRQFVGSITRAERSTSIKRINKRYPYIHPGTKRGYTARICVAIDQSGSVDDGQLSDFFSELAALTRRVTVDILPFDCAAEEKDIFEWKKGTNPKMQRVRGGGTDFNAPTELINSSKNRGRWDGYLIMTDGEAPSPIASRIKRGWVLSKGKKLIFDSQELQVTLDSSKPVAGAWR